jgi:hypothetical protein
LLAEKVVELKIAPKVSTMSVQRALKKMNLLIRHETTATLWLSISSKLVWMQQTAGS